MFPIVTNWNRRGESRSYPGRFSPQPEQIARLLARGPSLQLPPKDADAAKQTPIFVLVGGRDGGARVWQQAAR
jgi:hypothetical protein